MSISGHHPTRRTTMSRKKTAHEHWLSGDAGHRHKLTAKPPANEASAPTVVGGRPKCPPHLTPAERDQFRRISKLLGRRRVESEGDGDVIAVAAVVYCRLAEAKRLLDEEGLRITVEVADSHGVVRSKRINNPLLPIVGDLERRLLALLKALGLTPDSRKCVEPIAPPPPAPDDEEAAFAAFEKQLEQQGATNRVAN